MSKARKRHRQPWWKNKRKAKARRQWDLFGWAIAEVFAGRFCAAVVEFDR